MASSALDAREDRRGAMAAPLNAPAERADDHVGDDVALEQRARSMPTCADPLVPAAESTNAVRAASGNCAGGAG